MRLKTITGIITFFSCFLNFQRQLKKKVLWHHRITTAFKSRKNCHIFFLSQQNFPATVSSLYIAFLCFRDVFVQLSSATLVALWLKRPTERWINIKPRRTMPWKERGVFCAGAPVFIGWTRMTVAKAVHLTFRN